MTLSEQVYEQIRMALSQSGYSQRKLGKFSGMSETTISRILSGHLNITLKTADKILAALGADFKFQISTIKGGSPTASGSEQTRALRPVEALSNSGGST